MKMNMKMSSTISLLRAAAFVLVALLSTSVAAGECATNGGKDHCVPLAVGDWLYNMCDTASADMAKMHLWCTQGSGTWDPNIPGCIGGYGPLASEGEAHTRFLSFLGSYHNFCVAPHPSSTAFTWDTLNCGHSTGSVYVNDTEQSGGSLTVYEGTDWSSTSCETAWTNGLVTTRSRTVDCPPDSMRRTGTDGSIECVVPTCDCELGNPVNVGNGAKRQREVDYISAAPGGLTFVRLYNSVGYFDVTPRTPTNNDYWRHNYASKVYGYPGNAYVMAAVVRADGAVRYFNLSGVEVQNKDGAAYRMEKQVDGGGALTGWKITTPESDVELYDAQGKLTSITTRSGFVTTLAYDGQSRLQTVTDMFGRSITLGYDGSGRLSTMSDPASSSYAYGYDAQGRLSTVTYPDGKVRTYVYENATWRYALTGIVDERGARYATYGYDTFGRANSTEHAGFENKFTFSWNDFTTTAQANVVDAFNTAHTYTFSKIGGTLKMTQHQRTGASSETWTYDTNGNPLTRVDRNVQTNFVFDSVRNLETSRTEGFGTSLARTIATTWHSTFRLPVTITEPSGVAGVNLVTTFTYDTSGNLTKKNLTAGAKVREWDYTYNARGQLLTVDGPRTDVTDVTTIVYYGDSDTCVGCRGQVYTVTNAASHVTTFNTYNPDGRPTQITDANGVVTTLTYKPRGWLESRNVGGEVTSYDYDFVGNLSKVTLPDGSWLQYQYDAANALIGIDDSLGNSIDYELDVMGNRVQEFVYDPQQSLKKTLQRVYDGLNRLHRDLGAADQTTQYGYDNYDNVTTVTDPLFRVTTNGYDLLNRLTSITDAATGNTAFTYDAKDRLLTVKDPKLTATTTYTYDGLGNLLTQVSPDTGTTTFTYDNAGNVATQTDARSSATTYTYDTLNRVTAATVTDGTVTYEYDNTTTGGAYARGHLTKVTDPSGNTTYVYDNLGRVTSKVQTTTATLSNKTFTVSYSYSSGRQTGITYPSGRAITYGFNSQGQVTSVTVDGSTTILSAAEYFPFGPAKTWTWGNGQVMERTFDLDGRIKTLTLGPSTGTYADLSQVFGYDSLNRLVSANLAAGQTQSFTYDANSNRTNATINGASTNYTYPSTSHKLSSLSGATTRSFTYDNAGNTTVTAGVTYVYDGRGRMKQAGSTSYLVNGLGQRVKKSGGSDTYFAYDEAGHLIGEYDSTGAAIQETLWLGDTPVAVVKPATPSGFTAYYIWTDNLGTPRLISDISNQSRWEWANTDPFGNNAPNENPAGVGAFNHNLRFPGQYYDVETSLNYNSKRDYDPRVGRYVESDPIWLGGGLNTYGYTGGDPLSNIDPQGLAAFPIPTPFPIPVCGPGVSGGCRPMPPTPSPQPSPAQCYFNCIVGAKGGMSALNRGFSGALGKYGAVVGRLYEACMNSPPAWAVTITLGVEGCNRYCGYGSDMPTRRNLEAL
jgi:RHS repeat-associated protein